MRHTIKTEKRTDGFFGLVVAEIFGVAFGSLAVLSDLCNENIRHFLCPVLDGATLLEIFMCTLILSVLFIVASFFSGLFAFGQPLAVVLIMMKGAEFGLSAALIYQEKGFSAVPAVLLLCVPKALALSFVSLLAVREVRKNASVIFSFLLSDGLPDEKINIKLYCIKFTILLVIVLAIAAVDSVMNYFFSGLL